MLDKKQAETLLAEILPDGTDIQAGIEYQGIFIFRAIIPGDEAGYDPFFSVEPVTGVVRDFSVLTDGDTSEIARLFANEA